MFNLPFYRARENRAFHIAAYRRAEAELLQDAVDVHALRVGVGVTDITDMHDEIGLRHLFERGTERGHELMRQVRDDEPQPPRQLVRDIPPELERACLKALAKRQQDRYTTAADFADDLRSILRMADDASAVRTWNRLTDPGTARISTGQPQASR